MSHPAVSYKLTSDKAIDRLRAVVDDPGDHRPIDVAFAVLILELERRTRKQTETISVNVGATRNLIAKMELP